MISHCNTRLQDILILLNINLWLQNIAMCFFKIFTHIVQEQLGVEWTGGEGGQQGVAAGSGAGSF